MSDFQHDPALTEEKGIAPNYDAKDAKEVDAPVINTNITTAWLMDPVKAKGARRVTEAIHGDLLAQQLSLCNDLELMQSSMSLVLQLEMLLMGYRKIETSFDTIFFVAPWSTRSS